ncbi:MAG: hypothetical protein WDA27_08045 [Actinomycetota bacterium]
MKIRVMLLALAAMVVMLAGTGARADALCARALLPTGSAATACVALP